MLESIVYLGLFFYCLSSVLAVHMLLKGTHFSDRWVLTFSSAGCILFTSALLVDGLASGQVPLFGRFEAITCYCAAVTVAYVLLAARDSLRGLSAFILPFITVLLFAAKTPSAFSVPDLPPFDLIWLTAHVATAFLGYGCFTVASALAAAYLVQDFNLKNKRLGHVFERLPSLETTDAVMRSMIGVAFALFTVSVLAGVRLAHIANWQKELLADPKIVTVLLTWVLYAALLAFCSYSKRHGRRIAQITVIGLIFVLFSFLGIHALTHSTHNFIVNPPAESTGK